MNRCFLHGNCGKDPESKVINQKTVTKFSLATNKSYTNAEGEKITDTSWHSIILWGKVAEIAAKYVKKGTPLIIEGEISYRSYENKDGQTIPVTEIIGHNMHFTGSKQEDNTPQPKETWQGGKKEVKAMSDIDSLPQYVKDAENAPDDEMSSLPF